jgi:hypothetical protein
MAGEGEINDHYSNGKSLVCQFTGFGAKKEPERLCRQSYNQSVNPDAAGTFPLSYAGLSPAQRSGKLVAGAGFEPAAFRL